MRVGDDEVDREVDGDAAPLRLLEQRRRELDLVGLEQRVADRDPARGEEGVGHAAAEQQVVDEAEEVLDGVDLALDLGAADDRDERLLGALDADAASASTSRTSSRPAALRATRCGTPTTEAWARWTAPKASST